MSALEPYRNLDPEQQKQLLAAAVGQKGLSISTPEQTHHLQRHRGGRTASTLQVVCIRFEEVSCCWVGRTWGRSGAEVRAGEGEGGGLILVSMQRLLLDELPEPGFDAGALRRGVSPSDPRTMQLVHKYAAIGVTIGRRMLLFGCRATQTGGQRLQRMGNGSVMAAREERLRLWPVEPDFHA